jgi:hypothetical protein
MPSGCLLRCQQRWYVRVQIASVSSYFFIGFVFSCENILYFRTGLGINAGGWIDLTSEDTFEVKKKGEKYKMERR